MNRERRAVADGHTVQRSDAARLAALALGLAYAQRPPTLAVGLLAETGGDRATFDVAVNHIAGLVTIDEPLRAAARRLLATAQRRAPPTGPKTSLEARRARSGDTGG